MFSMKINELIAVNRLSCVLVVAAGLYFGDRGLCATDPTLDVQFARSGQSMTLLWGGVTRVSYQVEASSNLTDWTNVSPVMIGAGAQLSFISSSLDQSRGFFRVKRVFPAAPGSAAYELATGVLTIVGDAQHSVINVANDGTGVILVNGGAIPIIGGVA